MLRRRLFPRTNIGRQVAQPSCKPTVAVVRMQSCDYREACVGSRACCSRRRLDRPRNSAHPGILDERQHVLGDRRRALRHRWPGPAELALASVTCRPVVAEVGVTACTSQSRPNSFPRPGLTGVKAYPRGAPSSADRCNGSRTYARTTLGQRFGSRSRRGLKWGPSVSILSGRWW